MTTLKGFYDKYYSDQIAGTGPDPSEEATLQTTIQEAERDVNSAQNAFSISAAG